MIIYLQTLFSLHIQEHAIYRDPADLKWLTEKDCARYEPSFGMIGVIESSLENLSCVGGKVRDLLRAYEGGIP